MRRGQNRFITSSAWDCQHKPHLHQLKSWGSGVQRRHAGEGGRRKVLLGPQHLVTSQFIVKFALFKPKWGTAWSSTGCWCSKERCWPGCRDFYWAFPRSQVWSWIPEGDSFYFWLSSQSPREQLQRTTVFPKHVSGRQPLASPEEHAASARAHLGKN